MSNTNSNFGTASNDDKTYRIEVRAYMTKKATEAFDFMAKWNDDIPMPMRVMVGQVLRETNGMAYMRLHGAPEPSTHCLICGRILKHPVSLLYGVGPECGQHHHVNPFETKEELDAHYEEMKQAMAQITWEGWIIKSAVLNMEEVQESAEAPVPAIPETRPAVIPVYESKPEGVCPRDASVKCQRNLENDGEPCADCSVGRACCECNRKGLVKTPGAEFCPECHAKREARYNAKMAEWRAQGSKMDKESINGVMEVIFGDQPEGAF